jgi:hypothetical protein
MTTNDLGRTLEHSVESNLGELGERVRPQLEEAKRKLQALNGQATALIKEHPAACLLGALGLGYLIARIARRQTS